MSYSKIDKAKKRRRPKNGSKKDIDGRIRMQASNEYVLSYRGIDQLRLAKIGKDAPAGFPFAIVDGAQVIAFVATEKVGRVFLLSLWASQFVQAEIFNGIRLLKARIQNAF